MKICVLRRLNSAMNYQHRTELHCAATASLRTRYQRIYTGTIPPPYSAGRDATATWCRDACSPGTPRLGQRAYAGPHFPNAWHYFCRCQPLTGASLSPTYQAGMDREPTMFGRRRYGRALTYASRGDAAWHCSGPKTKAWLGERLRDTLAWHGCMRRQPFMPTSYAHRSLHATHRHQPFSQ